MKHLKVLMSAVLFVCAMSVHAQRKAVMILIDGVPADVLEQVATPAIDEIAAVGGYTRAYQGGGKDMYSQTPTISAPGYMNMITGVWGNKHNVWGNGVKNPNYNYWNVFHVVKAQAPEKKTAIFSTWLDNRTKLVGDGKAEAGGKIMDIAYDGYELDTVQFPHGNSRIFIYNIDEFVTDKAAETIKADAPDVSWVYLEYTDDMGHAFGDSPQMIDAVEKADAQIGRIWEAIKYRQEQFGEEWLLTVTTDHGRTESNGKGHGGQSERERTTWVVTNAQNLNARFESTPPVVDIMPTVLQHLNVEMPKEIAQEVDGVSWLGDVSLFGAVANYENGKLTLSWSQGSAGGNVTVYMAETNNFKTGGKDDYKKLGKAKLTEGTFTKSVQLEKGGTYKFLLEGKHNSTNVWLVLDK